MAKAKKPDRRTALSRLDGLLRRTVERPTENTIHRLRTTTRRAEEALRADPDLPVEKLLKQMKRIRKRAGELRDVDVQLALLASLGRKRDKDCVAVATALRKAREKQEKKIRVVVTDAIDSGLTERLARVCAEAKKQMAAHTVDLKGIADEFTEKLHNLPISEGTLHGFRTETKKLRYRTELAPEGELRDAMITELKKVQDAIGLWHDGVMLSETAEEVLGSSKRTSLISILQTRNRARYLESLRVVDRARLAIPTLFEPPAPKKPMVLVDISASRGHAATA